MLKKILLIISLLAFPLLSAADQVQINKNAPKTYTVVKGDTLWDISALFLEQPWLWPKLWRLNPEINNPHLIYPGDVLTLVYDEKGEPMLVIEKVKPNYKWSPKIRKQVRANNPIELLPLEVIAPFIRYDYLFSAEKLESLPYIIGSDEGYKSSIDGFNVYVNHNLVIAKTYAIYNKGEEIIDPQTDESLGFYVNLVGTAQVLRTGDMENKTPATLHVSSAKREIRSGDVVVPVREGQLLSSVFTMRPADSSMNGVIVKSSTNGREFGKFEVVMINKGSEHAVKAGDVMTIKRQSPAVIESGEGPIYADNVQGAGRLFGSDDSDYKMPLESLGELMVFKVYEKASMALILRTEKPVRLKDSVTAP